jgi:hypothetical protein
VQHRRGEAATEGHPGESPVVLYLRSAAGVSV